MTLARRARELVIVVALLAVPILFLRANLLRPERLTVVDRAVLRVSAPLQAGVLRAIEGVVAGWRQYVALIHVKRDNLRLLEENTRLRRDLLAAESRAGRVRELERLVGLKQRLQFDTLAARVIGIETSPLFRVARIQLDLGADEVRPGMGVLAAAGVVGRVQRVFGRYCDVLLAVDPKSSIDVVVARTGGRGVLKGVAGSDRYRTRLEYLDRNDQAAAGDLLVTSGIGGAFPRDVPVGTIVEVQKSGFGFHQRAEVQPVVDPSKLRDVLVVIAREAQPFGPSLPADAGAP